MVLSGIHNSLTSLRTITALQNAILQSVSWSDHHPDNNYTEYVDVILSRCHADTPAPVYLHHIPDDKVQKSFWNPSFSKLSVRPLHCLRSAPITELCLHPL